MSAQPRFTPPPPFLIPLVALGKALDQKPLEDLILSSYIPRQTHGAGAWGDSVHPSPAEPGSRGVSVGCSFEDDRSPVRGLWLVFFATPANAEEDNY